MSWYAIKHNQPTNQPEKRINNRLHFALIDRLISRKRSAGDECQGENLFFFFFFFVRSNSIITHFFLLDAIFPDSRLTVNCNKTKKKNLRFIDEKVL